MTRYHHVAVRVTTEEKQQIKALSARLFGKANISKLLLKLLRESLGDGPYLTQDEMYAFCIAVRQITGIARNLNQITKKLNASANPAAFNAHYLTQLQQYVQDLHIALVAVIEKTKTRKLGD